jgi:integrase
VCSALCGRLPGDGGSIPRRIAAGSGSWIVTPGDPDAKPLPQRAAAKIEREEMRFLTPAEIVDLAEAIHARYRALVFVGAYGGLRMGELAGLRQSRVDLLAGAVTVAETPTEVKGKLIAGPPKTRAGGPSGCRPSSSGSWRHTLPPRNGPAATSSPPPVGTAAGPELSGALLAAGYRGSRPAHPRPSPHRRGAVDRRRRDAHGGRRARGHTSVSFTLNRHGHQTIPRPVAEGRCHPVRD